MAAMEKRMSDRSTITEKNRIQTLDSGSFRPMVLEAEGRVAVEFMSYGCGYCRAIEPLLQRVAETIEADETIFRVNIAADPDLASEYGISGTPTFVMFLSGQELGRAEGPSPSFASVRDAVTSPFVS
jgi:thiol-disulfide isomerase/thioredoxin